MIAAVSKMPVFETSIFSFQLLSYLPRRKGSVSIIICDAEYYLIGEKIAVENIVTSDYIGSDYQPLTVNLKVKNNPSKPIGYLRHLTVGIKITVSRAAFSIAAFVNGKTGVFPEYQSSA